MSPLELVQHAGWLSEQPTLFQDAVLQRCCVRTHPAGEVIFHAGERCNGVYALVKGVLKFSLPTNGGSIKAHGLKQGVYWFGEIAALEQSVHTSTVSAHTDVDLLFLPLSGFVSIISDSDYFRIFSLLAAEHYREAVLEVSVLLDGSKEERVAARLCHLARTSGEARRPYKFHLSHADLGEMSNLSRQHVLAVLQSLTRKGFIKTGYKYIEIIDLKGLREIASNNAFSLLI